MELSQLFEPTEYRKRENFWTTSAIQKELSKYLKSKDVPTLKNLSVAIKKLRWQKIKSNGIVGYYVVLRKNARK